MGRQTCAAGSPTVHHDHRHETPDQQLAALGKAKMKTRRAEIGGIEVCGSSV